jgi:hypothetical protein
MSSGEHPILIQDAAAASVGAEPLQGHLGWVLALRCVGAVHDAVIADHFLKKFRHGCIK